MVRTESRMTLEEFLALPEQKPALEFEDGRVTQKVSPKGRHSRLQVALTVFIDSVIRPHGHGEVFTELRTTFAGMSRVPDLAVYARHRIPRDENGEVADDFFEPPDIAIEIRSPGQQRYRLIRRCRSFVANGVRAAVLVDPLDRVVLVARPDGTLVTLTASDMLDLTDVIPELRISIGELFDALRR